jgi:hypothetical protein
VFLAYVDPGLAGTVFQAGYLAVYLFAAALWQYVRRLVRR